MYLHAKGICEGDLLLAACRDLQDMEAAKVDATIFNNEEVFVNTPHEFLCADRTIKTSDNDRSASDPRSEFEQEDHIECGTAVENEGSRRLLVHERRLFAVITLHEPDENMFPTP